MKKYVAIAVLAVLLIAGIIFMRTSKPKEIVVGFSAPITGSAAGFGDTLKAGANEFVEEVNAAGGINGKQVRLEMVDDACDPKQGMNAASDLVNKKVDIVVGYACSAVLVPASDVLHEANLPTIAVATSNPQITERGYQNIFRNYGRDDVAGKAIADVLIKNYAQKKIAILHDKTLYGEGVAKIVKENLNAAGMTEALYDGITPGEKDYSAVITKLRDEKVDVLYYGGWYAEAGLIIRQAHEQNYPLQLVSGDTLGSKEFWNITGPSGQDAVFVNAADPSANAAAADVIQKLTAKNVDPDPIVLYSYSSMQVAKQALEAAGSTDHNAVIKALHEGTFPTIIGDVKFNDKGDNAAFAYTLDIWDQGKYRAVKDGEVLPGSSPVVGSIPANTTIDLTPVMSVTTPVAVTPAQPQQ